jgi:ribose transport system substrate-binding protein
VSGEQNDKFLDHPITRMRFFQTGLAAAGGFALLGEAGCGSSSSLSSSSSATNTGATSGAASKAQALVAAAARPSTTFVAPGPAFSAAKAQGKTAYAVMILSIPFAQVNKTGYQDGLKAAGVKLVALDGKGDVGATSTGIQYAIAQNANLILAETLSGALFAHDFAKAKSHGIPVIMAENQDPGPGWLIGEPPSVTATVDQCHRCAGTVMADFTVADSGDKGKAVIIWSADIPGIGKPQLAGIMNEFKRLGSQMTVEVKDVPIARWTSDLPTLTQTLMLDQSVDYLLPLYDGMVLSMLPSVHAANAQGRVKIVTFNATPSVLQSLKNGDVVAANVGANPEQYGWAFADQTLRLLTGQSPVKDVKLPLRVFTRDNINSIDLSAPQQTWYGNVDFKSQYKKLWGVS